MPKKLKRCWRKMTQVCPNVAMEKFSAKYNQNIE